MPFPYSCENCTKVYLCLTTDQVGSVDRVGANQCCLHPPLTSAHFSSRHQVQARFSTRKVGRSVLYKLKFLLLSYLQKFQLFPVIAIKYPWKKLEIRFNYLKKNENNEKRSAPFTKSLVQFSLSGK